MDISYQECKEIPMPLECTRVGMRVPFQPKIHRVKCLLADDSDAPALDIEQSAQKADLELDFDKAK